MQKRFDAIINKIKSQYINSKLHDNGMGIYKKWQKHINQTGEKFAKAGISANVISISGFIIGLLAINFLAMNMYFWALVCILVNRVFDALDGAVARATKINDFGVFLDACLDYAFYAGVIFGFALANPYQNAVAASFLLFAFTASACAMLAYSVVAYKNRPSQKLDLDQSPFYLGGLAQGFETLVALVVLCIVPNWFLQIAVILGCWCLFKSLFVISTAYYNFVIAAKNK